MSHSGIEIDPKIDEMVQKMLMPSKVPKEEQLKLIVFRINDKKDRIILDEENTKRVDELSDCSDVFKAIMDLFKDDQCRYALYDCAYESKDCGSKTDLVFISWSPDTACVREKMIYSASKEALKKKYPSIRYHWQLSDNADKNHADLIEKFGTKGAVMCLEGIPLCKK